MSDPTYENQNNPPERADSPNPAGWDNDFRDDMHKMRDDLKQGAQEFRQEFRVSHKHHKDGWIWGLLLILAGGLLLLQNYTNFQLVNWWALFILIPAFGSFADAWRQYVEQGRISRRVRGSLLSGLVFAIISAFFLFQFSLWQYWPVLLIISGVVILINAILPD